MLRLVCVHDLEVLCRGFGSGTPGDLSGLGTSDDHARTRSCGSFRRRCRCGAALRRHRGAGDAPRIARASRSDVPAASAQSFSFRRASIGAATIGCRSAARIQRPGSVAGTGPIVAAASATDSPERHCRDDGERRASTGSGAAHPAGSRRGTCRRHGRRVPCRACRRGCRRGHGTRWHQSTAEPQTLTIRASRIVLSCRSSSNTIGGTGLSGGSSTMTTPTARSASRPSANVAMLTP